MNPTPERDRWWPHWRGLWTGLVCCLLSLGAGFQTTAQDFLSAPSTNAAARVVIVQGEGLLHTFLPDEARVEAAFNRGLLHFTRTTNVAAAWLSLVATNDVVGIKVFSQPGPLCGTRPAVISALVRGLRTAGLPPANIVLWDHDLANLRRAGFDELATRLGVQIAAVTKSGYDTNEFYLPDSPVIGRLVWGDVEFGLTNAGVGKKSFLSRLLTERFTKIISVAPLMNETDAGTCGHLFSLALASADNTRRFQEGADRLAVAVPEIFALPALSDRAVLHITDALLAQHQGGPGSYLQFSRPLQQLWFSKDPVALDTLATKELARERKLAPDDPPPFRSNADLFKNATLLQLGISDTTRIQIERLK